MYAATLEAQEEIYALAEELGAGDAVRRVGLLRASVSEEEAEDVAGMSTALREDGFLGELVERDELLPAVARYALNGCLTEHDGSCSRRAGSARWRAPPRRPARASTTGTTVEGPVAPGDVSCARPAAACRAARGGGRRRRAARARPEYAPRVRSRRLHMTPPRRCPSA